MYFKELIIPENVNVELTGGRIKVSGPKGSIEKELEVPQGLKIEKTENKIKVSSETERRKFKALVGTVLAHIRNLADGVTKGFTYKLKIVYSHFPVTVKIEKDKVLIQNFLGEHIPRIANIIGNVQVKAEGPEITVSGMDLDEVGQTAANLEQACRVKARDRRVFQDGIWIFSRE